MSSEEIEILMDTLTELLEQEKIYEASLHGAKIKGRLRSTSRSSSLDEQFAEAARKGLPVEIEKA